MHNIVRSDEPKSLRDNKVTWTNDLLEQIEAIGSFDQVETGFKNRYRKEDVRDSLKNMNGGEDGFCFYCEKRIGDGDYGNIEHYRPKSVFHNLCFEWTNLHWSCVKCNTQKGVKWNEENPIIDPCDDTDDVRSHLSYSAFDLVGETANGAETIEVFGLNDRSRRKRLIDARMKVFIDLIKTIEEIKRNDRPQFKKQQFTEKLSQLSEEFEFRGMIEYTINILLK